jgi:hypothetical protein
MDSEIELNTTIQELRVVSTRPDLYSLLFETNCLQVMLGLLGHENIGSIINILNWYTIFILFYECEFFELQIYALA